MRKLVVVRRAQLSQAVTECSGSLSSVEIPLKDGAPPKEMRLFKFGENPTKTQGTFRFTKRSAELVMERAKEWGNEFHFDWDHHSAQTNQGVRAPSAAWWNLEVRDDGLYASNIRWTPDGKKDVSDLYYRYLSPRFDYDKSTREVTRITNAALTNLPDLNQLQALASSTAAAGASSEAPTQEETEKDDMDRKALLALLGLPESTSDVELQAKLHQMKQVESHVLAATGRATAGEAVGAMLSMKTESERAAKLSQEIETLKKKHEDEEKEAMLSQAEKDGKLEPGGDLRKQLATLPNEVVKATLSQLPKLAPSAKKPALKDDKPDPTKEGSAALSQEQAAANAKAAQWFDTNPEDTKKTWEKALASQQG